MLAFGHHAQASFERLELYLLRTWYDARGLHVLYRKHCTSYPYTLHLSSRIRKFGSLTGSIEWHADLCNHATTMSSIETSQSTRNQEILIMEDISVVCAKSHQMRGMTFH